MVKPRMVYISQTTEIGSVYSVAELRALRACCDDLGLYLHIDGARLGAALAANSDLSLAIMAEVADVFYIGGTKNGALLLYPICSNLSIVFEGKAGGRP